MKGYGTKYIVKVLRGVRVKEFQFSEEEQFMEFIETWEDDILVIYEIKTVQDYFIEKEGNE